jgi:uncharacterized glyoxalase superfamily protein PhnB
VSDAIDPLDALHAPIVPVSPSPAFAAQLRARLIRVLDLPTTAGEPAMTTTEPTPTTTDPSGPRRADLPGAPPGQPALAPYLAVADARAAIRYYTEAFGAVPDGSMVAAADGRIGHAQLRIRDSIVMLADPWDLPGLGDPVTLGATTVQLHLYVPDVDETYRRAVAAGGTGQRPPEGQAYGDRSAVVVDPSGHTWMLATAGPTLSEEQLTAQYAEGGFHLEPMDEVNLGERAPRPGPGPA